jgi:MFS family permease
VARFHPATPHLETRETDLRSRGCLQAANIDGVSMKMNRTASPLSRTAKVTVALLFVSWLVDYFDRLIMTFALPYIGKEFHLDHTQEGLLISAFFIAYAFSQLPGGVLADKVGTRKIIAIAMIVWSVFTGFTGLAWSFGSLLVIRFFFGIGEGVFPGASFKAISERTDPGERMTANGIMLSSNQLRP